MPLFFVKWRFRVLDRLRTYQGCVTDQCRNTPARPKSITSVTTALPFLNSTPARAGNNAKANESDAKDDVSLLTCTPSGCGFKISLASLRLYSEKFELLRGGMSKDVESVASVARRRNGAASSTVMARRKPNPGGLPPGPAPTVRLGGTGMSSITV